MNCNVTYEELAAYASAELPAERQAEIGRHVPRCDACRRRMESVRAADAALAALPRFRPPAGAILAARRAISAAVRDRPATEIMTLEEAAEFLRITPDQLGEIVESLPAFELAGQVRIRRGRLLECLEQRERDFTRQMSESWVAGSRVIGVGKGVA